MHLWLYLRNAKSPVLCAPLQAGRLDHTEDPVCPGSGHSCLLGSKPLSHAHIKSQQWGKGVSMPAASGPTLLKWTCPPPVPSCPGPENQAGNSFPIPPFPLSQPAVPTSSAPLLSLMPLSSHLLPPLWPQLSLLGAASTLTSSLSLVPFPADQLPTAFAYFSWVVLFVLYRSQD